MRGLDSNEYMMLGQVLASPADDGAAEYTPAQERVLSRLCDQGRVRAVRCSTCKALHPEVTPEGRKAFKIKTLLHHAPWLLM